MILPLLLDFQRMVFLQQRLMVEEKPPGHGKPFA
jgi:hypothetical protein